MKSILQYQTKNKSVATRILLYGDEYFKDKVDLLILNARFWLKTDLMNHLIFSEFKGVFPFIHDMSAVLYSYYVLRFLTF